MGDKQGIRDRVAQKAVKHGKEVGKEVKSQVSEMGSLAGGALASKGWMYPIQGFVYLISHPALYTPVKSAIVSALTMSIMVVGFMFLLTYVPQAGFLALFTGPLGFIAAVPLVLGEAYVIILPLGKILYLDTAAIDIFDATLLENGHENLVSRGRTLGAKHSNKIARLGKVAGKPLARLSPAAIARWLISLPLNAIPGIGTMLFLLYNGSQTGPGYHDRYFQLKGASIDREAFVKERRGAYTSFGTVALGLNLIPVVGICFTLSNACGAALWASDAERSQEHVKVNHAKSASDEL